ncbi:hypothetical protein SCP_0406960 [Sparassis crispa]|uniref:Nucleolus and neural progenitor protein-like N-terminal domain-containing protein n=1 Tax=Sparassis crispa TaxID=139825 RepID=A0A401GJH9_9APHY|nr:hypothetical protein SCP_0406960 [Sparassis crispa]GBE82312.1 hypothetical protein SCP_0406960 [Sparassis crispa]
MDMYNLVENERLSFWGDTSTRTPKVLKRSWTHFPDSRSVLFVLRRCSECCALVTKTRERLIEAYHSFTLIMQTGAFLQLVLTLAAVASRLGSLLIEVSATIVHCQHAFYEVLQAIDPTQAASVKHILQKDAVDDNAQSGGDILPQPATVPEPGEDLGNTVKRSSALVQETTANLLQVEQSPSLSTKAADRDSDLAAMSVVTSVRTAVKRKSSSSGPTLLPNDQSIQRRNGEHQQQNEVNKRKKKRDEIDDIFGF